MKYCLIGKTLSHSYSAILHRARGLDYALEEVSEADLASFVKTAPYDGFNVTIPYKQAVIPYLDELSPLAARLGAVNTVVRVDGRTVGYNTDYAGFLGALSYYGYPPYGVHAAVLGTGGAGRMAAMALRDSGAIVTVVSRHGEVDYINCYDRLMPHLIVNCTPVGTYPDDAPAPLDVSRFPTLELVYDLVYNPYRTRLVSEARRAGAQAHGGLAMLVMQALESERIWTGASYTPTDAKTCLRTLRNNTVNLVLMGMPSSGKTTLGRAVAEALAKPFVDVDDLITAKTGRTPKEIITSDGEPAFRSIEAQAVREVCALRGVVVALGGGSVLLSANRDLIHRTSFVVYVNRDLASLSDEDRPTLRQAGAAALYAERAPIYRALADATILNDGAVSSAVNAILTAYETISD